MYRSAVLAVFLSTLAIMAVDLLIRLARRSVQSRDRKGAVSPTGGLFRWLRVLVNIAGFVTLAAVAATGFSALLTKENEMTGDRLIWHVSTAPAFALAAVAITLFWAHRNRFAASPTSAGTWAVPLRKFFFWMAVALSVPTMVSILAAMFPLFGAGGQQDLVRIHRYCAPLLTAAGLLFGYFALVTWRERSQD